MHHVSRTIQIIPRRWSSSATGATRTALYNLHVENGGKMVDFGGYLLPVQYSDQGIASSHTHTRKSASIFDVSHMLQAFILGKDAIPCFESICTADLRALPPNSGTLTVFTDDQGNILDDLIVTKVNDKMLYVVSNAAMKTQDINIMQAAARKYSADKRDVCVEFLSSDDLSLIALQGPRSMEALQTVTAFDLKKLYFMTTTEAEIAGVGCCRITRCGYTGEDGFELSVPSTKIKHVTSTLLGVEGVRLAGLGARDSLRLEAGLCLYGADIDATTTPVEAALSWLVSKRRLAEGNFPGAQQIKNQLENGVEKRRIGIRMNTGPPARSGTEILNDDKIVGRITSGCPSPSLGGNVAMGYIREDLKKIGTKLQLKIREKLYPAEVAKMPFTQRNYYSKPKTS